MNSHDDLRSALQRGAAGMGEDQPLTLDDVKGRARGLRRRRAAVVGAATLAVVALAVPLGLSLTDETLSGPEIEPAAPTPGRLDVTPAPSDGFELPEPPYEFDLTTDRPGSTSLTLTTVSPGYIAPPDGRDPIPVEADYYDVAPLGTGWVAMRADDTGAATLDLVNAIGDVDASYPAESGLAVSADGSIVAYAAPGGRLMTVVEGEAPTLLYQGDATLDPVTVVGSDSCDPASEGGGCVVYANDAETGRNLTITSKGILSDVPALLAVTSVAQDGRVAGATRMTDSGACSAVIGIDGKPAWDTCLYRGLRFSPNGRFVMGINADSDGAGSSELAILRADTGELVSRVSSAAETQAFIAQAEWNDVDQVLMTVGRTGDWRVMGLSTSGDFTRVRDGAFESADPYVPDLHLQARP